MKQLFVLSAALTFFITISLGKELTFELPDNDKLCFYENIETGEEATLWYQVLRGGNTDVDVELSGANKQFLYREMKKQFDSFTWTVPYGGIHKVCFSNEFSSFTHKVVYFLLQIGEEVPVVEEKDGKYHGPQTMMEIAMSNIFSSLVLIEQHQLHLRHKETMGRAVAEELNEQVMYWSLGESLIVVFIGVGQVVLLRSFFRNTYRTSAPTIH